MEGRLLAAEVSGEIQGELAADPRCRVVVVDYGAKASIVRLLEDAGAEVEVVPHDATAAAIIALDPDGILLANGPGDPGAMDEHVAEVRGLVDAGRPLFGICLGHQLLGRALGLETYKLPFGHRGANHPVLERETGRVLVTSQNHGFAIRPPDDGGDGVEVTHSSLYDGTVEGLRVPGRPVWSVQFHPEAAPGPHDARPQLEAFVATCAAVREGVRLMPRRDDLALDRHHRQRPDRDRPGLRVRLLGRAGAQGAARGGLPHRPRQLQPGHDHDRPRPGPTATYIEPLDLERRAPTCCARERPDALLPTLGGQTALNLAMQLEAGASCASWGSS